ncbi:hypothetical protein RND71_035302 [Anisodus tanguticus]|uniref:Chlororespiratory reduction 21 n=1 Tax=Anisodus tanguticus TaxID=243964 RepID=A0AAE1R599_9SOLA|nr:hypothetical protein RND71_035302 [Anisodus tanguticus]
MEHVVPEFYGELLQGCVYERHLQLGQQIHAKILKSGDFFAKNEYIETKLVIFYAKCDAFNVSNNLFARLRKQNVFSWAAIIGLHCRNNMSEEALRKFIQMLENGILGDNFVLPNVLCLIDMYGKCGVLDDARKVFDCMVERNVVAWNATIVSYMQNGFNEEATGVFYDIRTEAIEPTRVTLSSFLSASANLCALQQELRDLKLGRKGHCFCIRSNFDNDVVVTSGILIMYAKCERIPDARRVFDYTVEKALVLWNTLLAAYAEVGLSGESLRLFYHMQLYGLPQNTISWNSVILGFLRNGQINEAIDIFTQMKTVGYRPNSASIVAALSAFTNMASLHEGRAIHGYILRQKILLSLPVKTALVDMYAKCGSLNCAKCIFDLIPEKELTFYNAMISGYVLHGCAVEALALFKRLSEGGMEPDSITFTSVLSSCCHAGLVKEGLDVLYDMLSVYYMKPSVEHYGCMITLLSRCGDLDEAMQLMQSMPFKPDANVFQSLLVACRELRETELEEHIANCLIKMEPDNSGHYVSLSNAYATSGRWNQVSKLRDFMKKKGLRKRPGCSWIQVGTEFHMFVLGDRWHPHTEEISTILALLDKEMQLT